MKTPYFYVILVMMLLGTPHFSTANEDGIQILKNSDLIEWNDKGVPTSWVSTGIAKEMSLIKDGKPSAKVTGRVGELVQWMPLKKGKTYRVSAWIYSDSKRFGCVGLRTKTYDWKLKLEGSKEPRKWKFVSKVYTADGTERLFYCINWYIGADEACYYSSPSVIELTEKAAAKYKSSI